MSATATSGAKSCTNGRISCAARTAAAYGLSGFSRVGKTWYSGACVNVMPAASTGSRHFRQVSIATVWPRSTSVPPSAIIGKAWPGSPKAPR